jgi:hypothetical protein
LANFTSKLGRSLANLAGFFGLSTGAPLFSAQGVFGIAAITGTFILLRTVYKKSAKAGHQKEIAEITGEHLFMIVFFAVSVFIVTEQAVISRH